MNYKPLLSSAPANSILNAGFRYTSSAATNIRKTFARVRRELLARANAAAVRPRNPSRENVQAIPRDWMSETLTGRELQR